MPGGAEVPGWLTHLVYDQGGKILASDVPGAFPGCSRVRLHAAIAELVPKLLPVFDITYGHDGFDLVGDNVASIEECCFVSVGHSVGTLEQSQPLPPQCRRSGGRRC